MNSALLFPYMIFLFLIVNPFFHFFDMWDGSCIEYAHLIHDFRGLQSLEKELGLIWNMPFWLCVDLLGRITGLGYLKINLFILAMSFWFYLKELFYLGSAFITWQRQSLFVATFCASTFPIWQIFYSSIMTFSFLCVVLGFIAVRWIHSQKKIQMIAGIFLAFLSLSVHSLMFFLPALSFFYAWTEKKTFLKSFTYPKVWFVGFLSLIYLIFFKKTPYGMYANYNTLSMSGWTLEKVQSLLRDYKSYLDPLIWVVLLLPFFFLLFRKSFPWKSYVMFVLMLLLLIFAGAFPYFAVGKSNHFLAWYDWSGRHMILMVLPISLLVGYVYGQALTFFDHSKWLRWGLLVGTFSFLCWQNGIPLLRGVGEKIARQRFEHQLEELIKEQKDSIPKGYVDIVGSYIPGPVFRIYESNYLMFRATKKAHYWTRIGVLAYLKNIPLLMPEEIRTHPPYQVGRVYEPNDEELTQYTSLEIEVSGFTNLYDQWVGAFFPSLAPSYVRLLRLKTNRVFAK